jgi:hypothetical protein
MLASECDPEAKSAINHQKIAMAANAEDKALCSIKSQQCVGSTRCIRKTTGNNTVCKASRIYPTSPL